MVSLVNNIQTQEEQKLRKKASLFWHTQKVSVDETGARDGLQLKRTVSFALFHRRNESKRAAEATRMKERSLVKKSILKSWCA
jgi:hypothetical protein